VGIDVAPGPSVDVVIDADRRWPLDDASFDAVLCTQVLEHVVDIDHTLSEIRRVLRPGGRVIITVPFIYNEHDPRHDYRRLSRQGVEALIASRYEDTRITPQGGFGSSVGVLLLNWIELSMTSSGRRSMVLFAAFPLWIMTCAIVNVAGRALDRVDRTGAFYGNVMVVARTRRPAPESRA
jgi:SAM-dependent methyltransferase